LFETSLEPKTRSLVCKTQNFTDLSPSTGGERGRNVDGLKGLAKKGWDLGGGEEDEKLFALTFQTGKLDLTEKVKGLPGRGNDSFKK